MLALSPHCFKFLEDPMSDLTLFQSFQVLGGGEVPMKGVGVGSGLEEVLSKSRVFEFLAFCLL